MILFVSLPLYCLNLNHNKTFSISLIPKYGGISTFYKNVIKYNSFKDENIKLSKENLSLNILPKKFVDIIGKNSIDFFPWDLTYFIPNQLNYQPRLFLQVVDILLSWLVKVLNCWQQKGLILCYGKKEMEG